MWRPLLVGVLVAAAAALPGPVAVAAEDPQHAVGLVIDTGTEVRKVCVRFPEDQITGEELLRRAPDVRAVFEQQAMGVAVCELCGVGNPDGDCLGVTSGQFWNYWLAGDGGWQWSPLGASRQTVRDGEVQAWSFGGARRQPLPVTFDQICFEGLATPDPTPTEIATVGPPPLVSAPEDPRAPAAPSPPAPPLAPAPSPPPPPDSEDSPDSPDSPDDPAAPAGGDPAPAPTPTAQVPPPTATPLAAPPTLPPAGGVVPPDLGLRSSEDLAGMSAAPPEVAPPAPVETEGPSPQPSVGTTERPLQVDAGSGAGTQTAGFGLVLSTLLGGALWLRHRRRESSHDADQPQR